MDTEIRETRCLFCSLGCRCVVEISPAGWRSMAPQDGTGLCARGLYIGDLMSHPGRLNAASERTESGLRPVPTHMAVEMLAKHIEGPGRKAFIIDGSASSEAVSAAVAFAATAPDTVGAVYLPAGDEAMLAGLDAAGWDGGAPPSAGNDVVLIVGDALGTHPGVARFVHESKFARRKNQVLAVASVAGQTAAHATRAFIVPPGEEGRLLVAVARRLKTTVPGVPSFEAPPEAEAIADALADAEAPAIVLSLPEGTSANAQIAALAAGRIARKLKAPLLPLFTYGNAVGAYRAAAQAGGIPIAELAVNAVAGNYATLVVIGVDLAAAMPELGRQMIGGAGYTVAAAAFGNETTAMADLVLPLGLWCEEEGTAQLPTGDTLRIEPPARPPSGAPTLAGLIAELRSRVPTREATVRRDDGQEKPSWDFSPALHTEGGLILVGESGMPGFADGALSSHSGWVQAVDGTPRLRMNPADCKRLKVFGGSTATAQTPAGSARVTVECSAGVPPGVASVPMSLGATRRLFLWQAGPQLAAMTCGPTEVTIRAAD